MRSTVANLAEKLMALEEVIPPMAMQHHSLSLAFDTGSRKILLLRLMCAGWEGVNIFLERKDLDLPTEQFVQNVIKAVQNDKKRIQSPPKLHIASRSAYVSRSIH